MMTEGIDFLMFDRDKPAPVPYGDWEQADDNPWVFLLKLPECGHRSKVEGKSACCGKVWKLRCERRNMTVTREQCRNCPDVNKAIGV